MKTRDELIERAECALGHAGYLDRMPREGPC